MTIEEITKKDRSEAHIHYIVAFIGGFLGLFPILNIAHIFGSSQTSNLIELLLSVFDGEKTNFLLHFFGAFLYSLAIFFVTFLPKHIKINIKLMSMIVDIGAAVVMFFMPKNVPVTVCLYPTFFAMAFQWSAFSGAYGFVCSTIFSTNNLKQLVSSFTEIYFNKNKTFLLKMKFFGAVLIAYHLGVSSAFLCHHFFDNAGFLFVLIPASLSSFLILRKKN